MSLPSQPFQAMDVTSLRAVLAELRPALLPSRFEKAQQPTPQALQLGLRGLHGRHWLEISWLAEAPRLLAIEPPLRRGEGSTLARQLQHGLAGLALVELEQNGWERVVELRFAPRPGEPVSRRLVVELMGRHSNLFLLDGPGRVIALARQVRQQQSRLRPIGSGDLYAPPPRLQGDVPSAVESAERWRRRLQLVPVSLSRALQQSYQGISPSLALQLAGDRPEESRRLLDTLVGDLEEAQWLELWSQWRRWLADLEEERFGFASGGATAYRCWGTAAPGPVNRPLAAFYGERLACLELQRRFQQLEQRLVGARERQERQRAEQQALLEQVENSDVLQRQADGLLCLAHPSRDQVAEAQALYKRARRLRRSVAAITPRLEKHDRQLERIDASLAFLALHRADGVAAAAEGTLEDRARSARQALVELEALEQEAEELLVRSGVESRASRRRSGPPDPATMPRPLELRTPGGLRVQVGRNHRQNEWISLRQARRGDLWFHAQECPGSHVMLKASEVPAVEGDLQVAADLAAHFSRARGNARVPVLMVPGDQLQRIAGTGPGTVSHRGGEVVWARPERAARWLAATPPLPSLAPEPGP